jgi:NAD(P)H-dependent flavin oxidoreductase YrpB (nitropropane dioxygenase family)
MAKDPLRTKLCDTLGIEYPIVAFSHCKDVVAAMTNAGAFAVLGGSRHTFGELVADIRWLRDRVGSRPFGIDLLFPASAPPSGTADDLESQIPDEHRRFVQGIKERHNIPEPKGPSELLQRWGGLIHERARRQLDVVLEERVPVLASGLGNPAFLIEAAHARGMQVWGLVGRPRQARRELDAGVDVIGAIGYDAAGHTGSIGTYSLVPSIVTMAGETPVLAGGGVTTGRHLAAAMALGAAGVWTGTLWLTCRESDEDMGMQERLLAATAEDTVHSRAVSGFTMRTLKSQWHVEWERPDAPKPLPGPFQFLLSMPVIQGASDAKMEEFKFEAAGQGIGLVTSVKPARQVVYGLVDEARAVFEQLTAEPPVAMG